jgi:phosphate transport system permease protein
MQALTRSTEYRKERGLASRLSDLCAGWLTRIAGVAIIFTVACLVVQLFLQALPAIQTFGIGYIFSSDWNPVTGAYGVLPQLIGTLITATLAMLIAVPVGLGAAVFLSEDFLPKQAREPLAFLLELLAAVPSVVYGLWGIFVLIPLLRVPSNWLHDQFSWFPFFGTPLSGPGILPAAVVLAVMILPTIAALSRDALLSQPQELRHGSYALGATRWETIMHILLPSARRAITGTMMLALGRALGETMAVAMLIGNASALSWSLFAPGTSISAHLANQFGEASGLQLSSLMFSALILLVVTMVVNLVASRLVRR